MTQRERTQEIEPLTDEELLGWDWRSTLRERERSIPWLARQTARAQQTVYNYSNGRAVAPIEWLRNAAIVLRRDA